VISSQLVLIESIVGLDPQRRGVPPGFCWRSPGGLTEAPTHRLVETLRVADMHADRSYDILLRLVAFSSNMRWFSAFSLIAVSFCI